MPDTACAHSVEGLVPSLLPMLALYFLHKAWSKKNGKSKDQNIKQF